MANNLNGDSGFRVLESWLIGRSYLSRIFILGLLAACLLPYSYAADQALDSNENLFTVLAALNAAGYDADIDSPHNNPLRMQVRQYLTERNIPGLSELKEFYQSHPPGTGPYISLALSITRPPEYGFSTRTVEIAPDAYALEKFLPLLDRFYAEAGIAALWKRVQPAFDEVIEHYQPPISRATLEVNSYLRSPTTSYPGRHFQVYIDLLAAPNQVQTRSYGDKYFVIVSPSPELKIQEIRHAFLHFVLDPLGSKYGADLMQKAALSDYVAGAPGLEDVYKTDFVLLATECLIKAIEYRLDKKPAEVDRALHEGYILTPYFSEQLPAYEKQPQAMRLYFPQLIAGIDSGRERRRLQNLAFTAKPKQEKVAVPKVALSPSAATSERAEELYAALDYEKAKDLFLQALAENGEAAEHAKAYYGLARIALRQNDPELSERLFQKTLESSPDAPSHAWCLIYLGRLSDLKGDRARASERYQESLAIKGASDQARKTAEQGLRESFSNRTNTP